jgi:L-threonylcarbamoyladenylate synthase
MKESVVVRCLQGTDMAAAVEAAARVIRDGGIIVAPTDTIYGLGCNASDENAVERIFTLKHRSDLKSALVLVADEASAWELAAGVPDAARRLAEKYWPGPLTMIFRAKQKMNRWIVPAAGTIAIRVPGHEFSRKLQAMAGTPVLSTSANLSGTATPSRFTDLRGLFDGKVDLMVDGGDAVTALPSTVVDVSGGEAVIVREGAIGSEEIRSYLAP